MSRPYRWWFNGKASLSPEVILLKIWHSGRDVPLI